MSDTAVTVSRKFDCSCERAFDAFLDPELASKFLFATDTGQMIRAEIDAQIGGSFILTDRRPEGDAEHRGVYIDLDRPNRIMFAFSVTGHSAEDDLVAIDFVARGSGCEVTLTHELKPEFSSMKDKAIQGWSGILEGLERVLAEAENQGEKSTTPKDSNGTALSEGDAVTVIKDLKVKGSTMTLKRGTMIKNIHLTDDAEAIEGRVDGSTVVLKTCFLKKA